MAKTAFSDRAIQNLHRDARGTFPSSYFWEEWTQCGEPGRQAIWDRLLLEVNLQDKKDEDYQLSKVELLRVDIKKLMISGKVKTWKEALNLLVIQEGTEDLEDYLYERGLTYFKVREIETKYNEEAA